MEKILLISNMYPSKKYKHYGVFVQNTASILKNNGYQVVRKIRWIFKFLFKKYLFVFISSL